MTFLSPAMLWALSAAAIPVIIHLFSLRHTREQEFSTLMFIKELEHQTIRTLRLKQWLLILLRTLAIIALVLAFAQPVRKGFVPSWMAGEQESHIVVVVDNSASMALNTEEGSLLERAKSAAPEILGSLRGQYVVDIYQTTPVKRVYHGSGQDSDFQTSLRNIPQSVGEDHIWITVDSLLHQLDVREPNRECFILSDFQTIPKSEDFADLFVSDSVKTPWRLYLLSQPPVSNNLSVRHAETTSQIRLPNQLLTFATRIENDGIVDKRTVPVELFLNDDRVGQVVASYIPGASREFMFQAYPGISGTVTGRVEIPDDDFAPDNQWSFEIPIPEQISVSLIGPSRKNLFLLEMALSSIDNQSGFLFLESREDSHVQELYLNDTDILILYNPPPLNEAVIADIRAFLQNGGGVIWFEGNRRVGSASPLVTRRLGIPVPRDHQQVGGESYFSVETGEPDHPLLENLKLRNLAGELPQVFQYISTRPMGDFETVLKLSNGDPLLLDIPAGKGRILYMSSLMDLAWNDLPMRGLMVPLVHRMLLLLATDETNSSPIQIGEPKYIALDREIINREWQLVTPSGKTILIIPDFATQQLPITQTMELGSYQVLSDGDLFTAFSTRLSPGEYPSVRADQERILSVFPTEQIRWIEPTHNLNDELAAIRYGKSLWRIFLLLAIFLLVLETALGRMNPGAFKQESSGTDS